MILTSQGHRLCAFFTVWLRNFGVSGFALQQMSNFVLAISEPKVKQLFSGFDTYLCAWRCPSVWPEPVIIKLKNKLTSFLILCKYIRSSLNSQHCYIIFLVLAISFTKFPLKWVCVHPRNDSVALREKKMSHLVGLKM